jgi:hypothetical protein
MPNKPLTKKERLVRQARGLEIDCVPTLGGWIGGVWNLAELAGIRAVEYLEDPLKGVLRAHHALDVDGMIQPAVPTYLEQIRTGQVVEADFAGIQPEAILERAYSLPDSEKAVLASFDAAAEEIHYREYFETAFKTWGKIEPVPNFWEIGGHFPLYTEFGYNAFWMACALYPEAVGKIYWAKSLHSRERAKILVRLYRDYDLVPLMFCGEDVCNNQGPMVSPAFLRKYYFPTVKMIVEPLVDSGVRLIHHCDGDVRPVIDDFIEIGFSGFQGFQYELGVDPYELRRKRSKLGEEPLFFAGLSVSRTLPFGSADDVRDEIDYFLDFTGGGKGLFLITSNVTGVEVPPENLRVAYRYIKEWDPTQPREVKWRQWPWAITHPE